MSEYNDGGFADRGNTPGSAGGVAQPGGSNSSSSGNQGFGLGGSGIGVGGYNFTSAFNGGELNPGVQAGVPAFSGFANAWGAGVPRRDQTLGDIQHQNAAANAAAARSGSSNAGSTSARSRTPTFRTVRRRNPITGIPEVVQVPVPPPKPPVPGWFGVPQYTPEDLPQDYFTHIPGVPLGPVPSYTPPSFDPQTGFDVRPGNPELPQSGPGGGVRDAITGDYGPPSTKDQSQLGGPKNQDRLQFGGPVAPGRSYTVGENGPEKFVPRQPGVIIPNPRDQMGGGYRGFSRGAAPPPMPQRSSGGGGGFLGRMRTLPPRPVKKTPMSQNMGFPVGRI
jgi:hypothetical protein